MLKEVGASGQISLGKKFAGRLFDVVCHDDDRFELLPMKVVPQGRAVLPQTLQAMKPVTSPDGWIPPGGYTQCSQWALDNREALTTYAQQIESEGTAAEQLEHYLASQSPAQPGAAGKKANKKVAGPGKKATGTATRTATRKSA